MIKLERYFSSTICSSGYCSAYNTIYKRDSNAKIYIIRDGNDVERASFFKRLIENLRGYNITLFNPFYDESTDGIYIKNLNTYILSDGGYNKITPILPEIWEKSISITNTRNYPKDLLREVLTGKSKENNHYKKACNLLNQASLVREKLHNSLSPRLDEDRIVNFIHRLCLRILNGASEKGRGEIRFLSSPTPLGFHTHYDTIFNICEKVICIKDETGFAGAIILSVIKNYARVRNMNFFASPAYFGKDFFQFLLFPSLNLSVCISDSNHQLPFIPQSEVNVSRFFTDKTILASKNVKALLTVENSLLDKAILSLFDGRDERFKYNNCIKEFTDTDTVIGCADDFSQALLN